MQKEQYNIYDKYSLTKPHSHVVYLAENYLQFLSKLDVLDMGCGRGRNSIYLNQLGHSVTSIDVDANQINILQNIIHKEELSNIYTRISDLQNTHLDNNYDVILLNVVLQFINDGLSVLRLAQKHTNIGGFHSIVCPIKTQNMQWPKHFVFLLESNQLNELYQNSGWKILDYNEDYGSLHRLDSNGLPIRGRFASLIAQKLF